MRRILLLGALLAAAAAATVGLAAAAPPTVGELVPGRSLGGLRLGATEAQVERAWGRAYGRCTSCRHETWYFNYYAFQPRGAGVEFRDGRAAAIFTIYQPGGWRTPAGLVLGEPDHRIEDEYGKLERRDCGHYDAFVIRRGAAVTTFYVLDDRLWGFGLVRRGLPLCR